MQFHGPAELLANLQRTLRITDGVVRFRIIKLEPGTPAPPARPERAPIESAEAPTPA
jgi:small subunit ribosomal protein S6